ncbi:MAG TPA: PilZ domain-containing protein [Phycisphaerae bacterium]|nr:PilZ domain-containing protein [Phycisphaerae bacterium]HRW51625.1 PilZ domain-containing protein [Phycisphaerae bacterium]
MSTNHDAIHARQFVRHAVSIEARIEPHADHSEQYRLAVPDAQSGLAVTDVSGGGLGLRSGIFVPNRMKVIVHVMAGSQESGVASEVIRVRAIVRRCEMIDHKPTYLIGLQFVDASGVDEKRLIAVANQVVHDETVGAGEAIAVGGAADA